MILSDLQALEYIKRPYCDKELEELKKRCRELRAYVTGKDIKKYMPRLPQFEREELESERLAMLVSPAPVISRIINPRSRIFSAKGGVEHFIIKSQSKEKEFRDYIEDITKGLSLNDWIKLIVIKRTDYDPNGVVLVERGTNGRIYPCFKSVLSFRDRQLNGRTPEYLILKLEPAEVDKLKSAKILHPNTKNTSDIYRVIDDSTDRIFNKEKKLSEIKSFYAPKFPGRVASNIFNENEEDVFNSPFDVIYEDIKTYLLWSSLYNVVFARQSFPKEWMHRFGCPTCEGSGVIDGLRCPECKGTRILLSLKHSDVAIVDWGDENNKNIPNPPMGNTEAAVDTLEHFGEVLEMKEDKLYYGVWGMFRSDRSGSIGAVQRDKSGGSGIEPTAYQAMLNSQPMVTQLVEYGKWFADMKKFICDVSGKVTIGNDYQGSAILCGDRYMIESPDATWDRYLKAVKAEAPMAELDSILIEYIENKYANNPLLYRKYMLLIGAEPFLHYNIEQVLGFDIPMIQKYEKIYFDEWKTSMSDWDFNMIADGYCEDDDEEDSDLEEGKKNDPIKNLKESLREFTLERIKDDGGLEKPRVTPDGTLIPINSIVIKEEVTGNITAK